MTYESSIALRYLRSKRKEKFISFTTWAAAVGIAIGVMALIVVIAVMTGFQDEIRDRILGVNPHMLISDLSGEIVNPDQVVAAVKNTEGVAAAFPFITFQGLAQSGQRVSGVVVKGVDPKDLSFMSHLVKEGSIDALCEKGTVLVAKELGPGAGREDRRCLHDTRAFWRDFTDGRHTRDHTCQGGRYISDGDV